MMEPIYISINSIFGWSMKKMEFIFKTALIVQLQKDNFL